MNTQTASATAEAVVLYRLFTAYHAERTNGRRPKGLKSSRSIYFLCAPERTVMSQNVIFEINLEYTFACCEK